MRREHAIRVGEWNFAFRKFRRTWLKRWLEFRARRAGLRFACNALAGNSAYSICVNSDMTVSCNCQDYDGLGQIGDLRKQTFEEIFDGPVARGFRHELAEGRLPIWTCTRCMELKRVPKAEAQAWETTFQPARHGLMLENTSLCNLQCVDCARKTVMRSRVRPRLSLDDMRVVADVVRRRNIALVCYFNLGEPFMSPDILEEMRILRAAAPATRIVTSTNGVPLNTDAKREAALLFDNIVFSIDGMSDATLTPYQCGGNFQKAYDNMRELVEFRNARGSSRPVIEWKYILFNWNDRERFVRKALALAKAARIDSISFQPTFYPFYGISWRYWANNRFFRNLGPKSEKSITPGLCLDVAKLP